MVDENEVFRVADELSGERKVVSLRSVIPRLAKGGSHRAVGAALRNWKTDRNHRPLAVDPDVAGDQRRLDGLARMFWDAARQCAAAAFDDQRSRLEAQCLAATELSTEAFAKVDGLLGEIEALKTQGELLRQKLAAESLHQDRRAREFWDRVMIEIWRHLAATGPRTLTQLLESIPPDLRRESTYHTEKLNARTLQNKMNVRTGRDKYFERGPDGSYQARSD